MESHDYEAAEKWVEGLDDDTMNGLLERAAKLDAKERRQLLADPRAFFEAAGLRPPEGVDIQLQEQKFADFRRPEDLRWPDWDIPRLIVICFQICFWVFTPWGFKRICRLYCIRL